MSNTQLNTNRLNSEIENRATKIWGYVRDHRNSLSAETHIRRIREMVARRFTHFENVCEALRGELNLEREKVSRKIAIIKSRDQTIRELRKELKERQALTRLTETVTQTH